MNTVCGFKTEVSKLQFEVRHRAAPHAGRRIEGPEIG